MLKQFIITFTCSYFVHTFCTEEIRHLRCGIYTYRGSTASRSGLSRGWTPTLGTDSSIDIRATLVFLCASPLLTRSSVTAPDFCTIDTDPFLVRGVCTVTAGSREVLGAEPGPTLTTSLRSKAVRFSSLNLGRAQTRCWYMRHRLFGDSVLCVAPDGTSQRREMQREVNTGCPFESRLHIDIVFLIDITTIIIFLSFAQQPISIVSSWLFSH